MSSWNSLLEIINKRIRDLEHDKKIRTSHIFEHEYRDLSLHRQRLRMITSSARHRRHERPETCLHNLITSETFHSVSNIITRHRHKRLDANEYYKVLTRLTGMIEHEKTVMEIEDASIHDESRHVFINAFKELKVFIITKTPINRFVNIQRLKRVRDFNVLVKVIQDFHTIRPV